MASVGHVAVGLLAARTLRPESTSRARVAMVVLGAVSLLPDLDYLGVALLGVPNVGPCGHRGASHALLPVLLVALVAAWLAPRFGLPRLKTAVLTAAVVASHGLLDAMTMGARGVPALWPFSFQRFVMPWRPIPDSPCGLAYLSMAGLRVAAIEALQFLPLLAFAFRPATRTPALAATAVVAIDPAKPRLQPPLRRAIR
jgi:inner membrane protein